jgi:hypothetical protein
MRTTGDEAPIVCQEERIAEMLDPPREVGELSNRQRLHASEDGGEERGRSEA